MTPTSPILENVIAFLVVENWDVDVLRIGTFEAQGLYEREESIPAEAARTEPR